jgi:hypothetical protein
MKLTLYFEQVLKNGGAGARLCYRFTAGGTPCQPLESHVDSLFNEWLEHSARNSHEAEDFGVWVQNGCVCTFESDSNLAVVRSVSAVRDRLMKCVTEDPASQGILFEESY